MTCARRVVTATYITPDGRRFVGRNDCDNPQTSCPRGDAPPGVGYELCSSVCRQPAHAEIVALRAAGAAASGGLLYVEGHTYACRACLARADMLGVVIILGSPP